MKALGAIVAMALGLMGGAAVAADAPYLFDVLKKNAAYRKSWNALLAHSRPLPEWVGIFSKTYNGVASPMEPATVDGVAYETFNVCKPHDCGDNWLEVYFTRGGAKVYGILGADDAKPRLLGAPPAAVAAALMEAVPR